MNRNKFYRENLINQKKALATIKNRPQPLEIKIGRIKLKVLRGVWDPRTDTKFFVRLLKIKKEDLVLDACSGSGAIAIFAAARAKKVYATDINSQAIKNIRLNAKLNNFANKVTALKTNVFPKQPLKFDVITIDPPYTDFQAKDITDKATFDKSHKTLIHFLNHAKNYLKPTGKILISWANFADFKLLEKLLKKSGYNYKIIVQAKSSPRVYRVYQLASKQKIG